MWNIEWLYIDSRYGLAVLFARNVEVRGASGHRIYLCHKIRGQPHHIPSIEVCPFSSAFHDYQKLGGLGNQACQRTAHWAPHARQDSSNANGEAIPSFLSYTYSGPENPKILGRDLMIDKADKLGLLTRARALANGKTG